MSKPAKKQAIAAIWQAGNGVVMAIGDLLECELEEARQELEAASTEQEMWRSQGKCQALRNLARYLKNGGRA